MGKVQGDGQRRIAVGQGAALPVVLGQGLSGGQKHLQGPDDPLFVVGVDAPGGVGVHLGQLGVQGGQALLSGAGLELGPKAAVRLEGGELPARHEMVDVKPRPPGDDGQLSPGQDAVHNGHGVRHVPGHGVVLLRLRHVDHVVGDAPLLRPGGLGGADVHAAVDLHGVGGHHLPAEAEGQLRGQGGLARGGGAADHQDVGFHGRPPFERIVPHRIP